MGGLFGGGNKQKSESGNHAEDFINDTFGGAAGYTGSSSNQIAGLLGLGGGDPQAFQKYLDSSGYKFTLDSGSKAITGNAASRGLLNSGSTLKALTQFGQDLASTKMDNYLGQLGSLAKIGLGAGGLVADAGQYSKGSAGSGGGLGSFLGALLACDIRLKDNVELVGTLPGGLSLYAFDYIPGHGLPEGRHVGPMAHEVAEKQPQALGPKIDGYLTIDPAKLNPPRILEFM
jgi:hypothetical protein